MNLCKSLQLIVLTVAWNLSYYTKSFLFLLQVLKKDLYFDPEFWNLIALRTNCLKLMSEKGVSSALEEIMEDKWILNYYAKEPALRSSISGYTKGSKGLKAAKKRHQNKDRHRKEDSDIAIKRFKVGSGKTRLNVDHTVKRKGKQGSRSMKDTSEPLRRSFWQLDRLKTNWGHEEHRRTTRLSEKNPPKRRIRTPKWLLEDSGTLEKKNIPSKIKKHSLRHQKHHLSSIEKSSETGHIKNNPKQKPTVSSDVMAKENNSKHRKDFSLGCLQPASPPQVILELSLPDNELMGTFIEDTCNRHRGFPQVLLYKPTVKHPATSQPVKAVHRNEVILRARDSTMFILQLHCYARRLKGKGNGANIQGSVSTITRSSMQGNPSKAAPRKLCKTPAAEMKAGLASTTPTGEVHKTSVLGNVLQAQGLKAGFKKTSSVKERSEKSAVEPKGNASEVAMEIDPPVLDQVTQDVFTENLETKYPLESAAIMKFASVSQIPAETEVTEIPVLDKGLQAQTKQNCEEPSVEMKVTIASQTPKESKVSQSKGLDMVSKAQTIKAPSETTTTADVSHTSAVGIDQIEVVEKVLPVSGMPNILNTADVGPVASPSQHFDDEKQVNPPSSQKEGICSEMVTTVSNNISVMDDPFKPLEEQVHFRNDASIHSEGKMVTSTNPGPVSTNDISDLTLVTEMVTELTSERQAHKQLAPEDSVSKESRLESKSDATFNCSVPKLGVSAVADVQLQTEGTDDSAPEENSEPTESEESKLEFCCTFCNKVFKGSRVVAHAMFHYRKDECMFCGMMFKDDLLAMMHLSDHIEKLKRSKESACNKGQENRLSETKDFSTSKTSARAKEVNTSSGQRSRGRPRKSVVCPKSINLPDSTPPGPRKLRSNGKPFDGPSTQDNRAPGHKVNGHTGTKRLLDRLETLNSRPKQSSTQEEIAQKRKKEGAELQKSQGKERDSATLMQVHKEFSCSTEKKEVETHVKKTKAKQDGKSVIEKNTDPQKVCCPVAGCTWFTDLSKNRVSLLYHALEDHYGEVRPLELAFRIGNNKCSICMRVLWSFEHFLHHVERHRLSPRHPCLHQGCTARFKTGMEMRRHTRRHSPLQAVCCLPGCSKLFICLWALNLHEREHYASKPSKPEKSSNMQTRDKHNLLSGKKQLEQNDHTAINSVDQTVCVKALCKSSGQAAQNSTDKHFTTLSSSTGASLLKREFKGSSEDKDSHVLKNLSNKDTSAQPTGPTLRLRRKVGKNKATTQKYNTVLKSHKAISSLFKHNIKLRHRFMKKKMKLNTECLRKRGRPPKLKKAVHDENSNGQDNEAATVKREERSPAPCASTSKEDNSNKELKSSPDPTVDKTTGILINSKSKKSVNKPIKRTHLNQKGTSHNTPSIVTTSCLTQSNTAISTAKILKALAVKMKKLHEVKKRAAPKDNGSHTGLSDLSKKKQDDESKLCPLKEPESVNVNSVSPEVEPKPTEENFISETENEDLTQKLLAVPPKCFSEINAPSITLGEKTRMVTTEEKSKFATTKRKASDSANKSKKQKTSHKGDKTLMKQKQLSKDVSKKSLKKTAKSRSVDQTLEAKAVAEDSSNVTLNCSSSSAPSAATTSLKEIPSPLTATKENRPKVTTKEKLKKSLKKTTDVNKIKKPKVKKGGDAKAANTKCKDPSVSSTQKLETSKPEVQTLGEVKEVVVSSVAEEGTTPGETPQSAVKCPGYSLIVSGQAATEDVKSTVCLETLEKYGKKPYMRLPPTAYLDERYTTMPKRRKETLLSQSPQKTEEEKVTAALQRQRCANCFATFNSAEELYNHVQVQKCSNLFGFDSDDEGES